VAGLAARAEANASYAQIVSMVMSLVTTYGTYEGQPLVNIQENPPHMHTQ